MCCFTFYSGAAIRLDTLLVEAAHSLIRQSSHSLERAEPLNGDSFGVGWSVQRTLADAGDVSLHHSVLEQSKLAQSGESRRQRLCDGSRARREPLELYYHVGNAVSR